MGDVQEADSTLVANHAGVDARWFAEYPHARMCISLGTIPPLIPLSGPIGEQAMMFTTPKTTATY